MQFSPLKLPASEQALQVLLQLREVRSFPSVSFFIRGRAKLSKPMVSLPLISSHITLFQQHSRFRVHHSLHCSNPIKSCPETTTNNSKTLVRSSCIQGNNDLFYDSQVDSTISAASQSPDLSFSGSLPSTSGHFDHNKVVSWLQSCRSVREIKRVHAILLRCLGEQVTYVDNNLISGYLRFSRLAEARKVFDQMTDRNVVTWTAVVNGYLRLGFEEEALRLFGDSILSGVIANGNMFVCVLNLCSRRQDFALGAQVHACVLKGNWRNLIVDNAIVHFYAQVGDLWSAFCAFNGMPEKDVVCWTTMITACSQHGRGEEAFLMFSQMLTGGFSPNEFTVCSILKACGEKKALKFGRQLHGTIAKKMVKNDVFVETSLVDMYGKCGEILHARKLFDGMQVRNMVTWTSIISGYARKGIGEDAIRLFRVMRRRNIAVSNLTIVSILRGCGSIGALLTGREVHAQILKKSIHTNMYVGSTLVWMYCKCREYEVASRVLQRMPLRDVVSWTAMISGCANLGHESEALEFLKQMMNEGVEPNSFTCSSALKACANLEAVRQGKLIHSFANKTSSMDNVFVGSALINMYAKCGFLSEASQVFDSMQERNLVSWKAMIMGYARSGLCQEALKLLYRMQAEGIQVDDYILSTVLAACGDLEWDKSSSPPCYLQSTT